MYLLLFAPHGNDLCACDGVNSAERRVRAKGEGVFHGGVQAGGDDEDPAGGAEGVEQGVGREKDCESPPRHFVTCNSDKTMVPLCRGVGFESRSVSSRKRRLQRLYTPGANVVTV